MISSLALAWSVYLPGMCLGTGPGQGFPAILEHAMKSERSIRLSGTRVVKYRRGAEYQSHTEYWTQEGPRIRIDFPEDSKFHGEVIVEDEHERMHYFPDHNELQIGPARHESAFRFLKRVGNESKRRFRIEELSGETVGGYVTQLVQFSDPRGNIFQKIYIEPRSGAVLARRIFDRVGSEIGSFEFSNINLNPQIDKSLFTIRRNGVTVVHPIDLLRKMATKDGFLPISLPLSTGFALESVRIRDIAGQRCLVSSYVSAEGNLNLFQISAPLDPDRLRNLTRGTSHVVTRSLGDKSFVLVGSFDENRLKLLSSSLKSE